MDKVMEKSYTINLTTQLIKNFNAQSKIAVDVNTLFSKNCDSINISKNEKISLQKQLASYV